MPIKNGQAEYFDLNICTVFSKFQLVWGEKLGGKIYRKLPLNELVIVGIDSPPDGLSRND